MSRPLLALVLMLLCIGSALPAAAAGLAPLEIAERLQQTYEQTKTLTADFEQETTMPMGRRPRHGSGRVAIKKPGLIRWDYTEPDRQVLVSDGTTFSMYLAANNQMMVMPAENYLDSDVAFAFFAGTGNILRDFAVSRPTVDEAVPADEYCIRLEPREPHPQLSYLHAWLDADTFLIRRLRLVDQFGSITDLVFSHVTINEPLADAVFSFTPPPGTEIIKP